jgi:hypothetical protein
MMKNDERIIKYIEDELTPDERIAFEFALKNSLELREVFENYFRLKEEVKDHKKLKLNQAYLDSLIPEFRIKIDSPKIFSAKKNLGYAFGVMSVIILSVLVLKNFFGNDIESNDLQKFAQSLNENQRIELLQEINGESEIDKIIPEGISGAEITDLLSSELEINGEIVETYDISNSDLMVGLSQQEVENIYSEILNRNF